ncbi:hypothetical protein [Paraclostridium sordellii]|uniref:hypothetical protein n=1 Tax=Paraclostridium sordellii TaxID=1505 RepID=UPI0005E4EE2D|nr:hypothetical protein [Paeniclostridium sordellii]CEN24541.1 Uncharacterised protein [[Clostridium] sordellii] [Paeniclostridium sordellii]
MKLSSKILSGTLVIGVSVFLFTFNLQPQSTTEKDEPIAENHHSIQGYFENFIGLHKDKLRSDLTQLGWMQYNEIKRKETLEMWEEEKGNNLTFSYDENEIILAVEYKEL